MAAIIASDPCKSLAQVAALDELPAAMPNQKPYLEP